MLKELIEGFVKNQVEKQITKFVGIDNNASTGGAIHDTIGALIGGLAKNTKSAEGTDSLINALDKDHDGSILDDVTGLLQHQTEGEGILKHILGNKQEGIASLIGQKNGLQSSQASKILALVAPIIMGFLGKQKKEGTINIDNISSLLNNENKAFASEEGENPLAMFLDQDGDGDVDMQDLAKLAG